MFPATACIVQEKLGATNAWAFDIEAACSGFTYALTMGAQFIESGAHRKVLVIGADVMTFGDGAGAVLLEPSEDDTGIVGFLHEVDGTGRKFLYMLGGGSLNPATKDTVAQGMHFIRQEGQHVFKYAVRKMADASERLIERFGVKPEEVDLFVAHQANVRIIDAAQQRLGLPDSKVVKNIDRYGNTTAATIPLALGTALDEGRLKPGHVVIMTSVGAGFTVGSVLLRWSAVPWN
jgi:3-oxoacyl-[acyl-carrier-protein] synthase-3